MQTIQIHHAPRIKAKLVPHHSIIIQRITAMKLSTAIVIFTIWIMAI